MMNDILAFLLGCEVFYLATADGGQPKVRPFGAALAFEGRLYMGTSNLKNVYAQMKRNPKVEIAATSAGGEWIRLTGEAVFDMRTEAKEALLEAVPVLKPKYSAEDGVFEVFYLRDATADIFSFDGENEKRASYRADHAGMWKAMK